MEVRDGTDMTSTVLIAVAFGRQIKIWIGANRNLWISGDLSSSEMEEKLDNDQPQVNFHLSTMTSKGPKYTPAESGSGET